VAKKDLRQFNGFADTSDEHKKKILEKLRQLETNSLRAIADILQVERSGNKVRSERSSRAHRDRARGRTSSPPEYPTSCTSRAARTCVAAPART
jgi:hypothetical protein